jgi:thiosulfate/3-mercaptopyruvate sulfurtransferase
MAEFGRPELLADGDWLRAHLDDPNLRFVDCDGATAYRRAHIPGAVVPAGWDAGGVGGAAPDHS